MSEKINSSLVFGDISPKDAHTVAKKFGLTSTIKIDSEFALSSLKPHGVLYLSHSFQPQIDIAQFSAEIVLRHIDKDDQ